MMDNSLHPKSFEKGRFRVVKLFNRKTKLIHQMWDEMVTMMIIKKDNKMVTISKVVQIDVDSPSMNRAPNNKKWR
jgi:hypothetical protein